MSRDDIIRMAREAGYQHPKAVGACEDFAYFNLERFAALVAAAEREECAKVCERKAMDDEGGAGYAIGMSAAAAIRARG